MSIVEYLNIDKTNLITVSPYQETTVEMDDKKSWKYWVKFYVLYTVIVASFLTIIFLIVFGLNTLALRHIPRNITDTNITIDDALEMMVLKYNPDDGLDFESQILLNSNSTTPSGRPKNGTTTENWDDWEEIKIFNKTVILNGTNTTIIINSNNFVKEDKKASTLRPPKPSLEKTIFKKDIPNLYAS